jgi:hypothetical protein
MLDIILLYFFAKHIGKLALKKGLPPMPWKLRLIGLWLGLEMLGLFFGIAFFGTGNMPALISLGLVSAFGGYLLIKYILDNKPDQKQFDDIDNMGNNH